MLYFTRGLLSRELFSFEKLAIVECNLFAKLKFRKPLRLNIVGNENLKLAILTTYGRKIPTRLTFKSNKACKFLCQEKYEKETSAGLIICFSLNHGYYCILKIARC